MVKHVARLKNWPYLGAVTARFGSLGCGAIRMQKVEAVGPMVLQNYCKHGREGADLE